MTLRPFHHQRPLFATALAYGVGLWAGVRFAWRPVLGLAGLGFSILACFLLPAAGRRRVVGCMAAALFAGMLAAGAVSHPSLPPAGRYQVTGTLSSDAVLREDGTAAAYLEDASLSSEESPARRVGRLYWTYTPDPEAPFLPREGERVSFTGKIYHPQGQVNPYGFDFRLFLLQRGIVLGASGAADAQALGHPGRGAASFFYALRAGLSQRIDAVFGEGSALPRTMLLGLREDLPQDVTRGFSSAGVAHLLSVSGLHVALLAGALLAPLRRFASVRVRFLVLAAFLLLYCALLDFSAPVVRASLLMLLAQGRRMVRRAPDPLTALSAAFLGILLFRPLDLFSASFQLSFCAVLGMILLMPPLKRLLQRARPRFVREGLAATLSATAGAALPTIQIFHRLSLIGLVINPLACAAFGVLLPAYAAVLLVGCVFLPAGQALAIPVNAAAGGLVTALKTLGQLPFATVRIPFLPWYCVGTLAAAAWLCTRYIPWKGKKKLLLGLAAVVLAFGGWRLSICRDVQYVQLAMGQADAALILDGAQTAVIDAGKYGGDVAAYLLSTGREIDQLFLTHLHSDHCLGVQEILAEEIPIKAVYLPLGGEEQQVDEACLDVMRTLREKDIPVYFLQAGDEIATRRVRISVTWPRADTLRTGQDANRYPLALLCDLDGVRLFSASDLSGLFETYAARDADILKTAHHGSKSSTGEAFLSIVSPRAALITGSTGSALLPHADTLSRLARADIPVYNTGDWGALTITVRGGEGQLVPYLERKEQP